nr:hypothetical protein [Tanacetum cinerariifolium]
MQLKEGKVASSKALDVRLIVTKCSGIKSDKQDTSSRSRNDTHVEDVNIKPVNDKEPMAEIKKEIEVLETINIELEHNVAKLLAENEKLHKENENLKQTYKDLYDFIKKTRVQTKDHNESLFAQINNKTVENADLKAQIQEKGIHKQKQSPNSSQGVKEQQQQHGEIKEEVYVSQPEGFVYQDNPLHAYKLIKALYSLKQAPHAWYNMLSSLLISQHFSKRCSRSDALHTESKKSKLDEDLQGKPVDATLYHGMIGSLMYLTSSRPDLIYVVCLCSRYQDTDMSLTAYAYADHAGCQDTRRNTSGSAQFLGDKFVSWSSKKQKSTAISRAGGEWNHGLYFLRTEYQLADIFTEPLPRERFNFLIEKLDMISMSSKTLKRLAEETNE